MQAELELRFFFSLSLGLCIREYATNETNQANGKFFRENEKISYIVGKNPA